MKPFNLERAKAGKPFTRRSGWKNISLKFLGIMSNGDVAYEFQDPHGGPRVAQAHPDHLFMIAEKLKYTATLVRFASGNVGVVRSDMIDKSDEVLSSYTFEYEE